MLAVIENVEGGYIAQYDRPLYHTIEEVWQVLTQNEKLVNWMPNLQVIELKKDGVIKFNMNDGTEASFDIKILDYKEKEVLEFEWGSGWVRFELHSQSEGSLLVLKEFIPTISNHTSKDLAGWHVCLDVMKDLLNGQTHEEFPKENWEKWHKQYVIFCQSVK